MDSNQKVTHPVRSAVTQLLSAVSRALRKTTAFGRDVLVMMIPSKLRDHLNIRPPFQKNMAERTVVPQDPELDALIHRLGPDSPDVYRAKMAKGVSFSRAAAAKAAFVEALNDVLVDIESQYSGEIRRRDVNQLRSFFLGNVSDTNNLNEILKLIQSKAPEPVQRELMLRFEQFCQEFDAQEYLSPESRQTLEDAHKGDPFGTTRLALYTWLKLNLGESYTGEKKSGHFREYQPWEKILLTSIYPCDSLNELHNTVLETVPFQEYIPFLNHWLKFLESEGLNVNQIDGDRDSPLVGETYRSIKEPLFNYLKSAHNPGSQEEVSSIQWLAHTLYKMDDIDKIVAAIDNHAPEDHHAPLLLLTLELIQHSPEPIILSEDSQLILDNQLDMVKQAITPYLNQLNLEENTAEPFNEFLADCHSCREIMELINMLLPEEGAKQLLNQLKPLQLPVNISD